VCVCVRVCGGGGGRGNARETRFDQKLGEDVCQKRPTTSVRRDLSSCSARLDLISNFAHTYTLVHVVHIHMYIRKTPWGCGGKTCVKRDLL
jgi:hypothetical protein